MKNFNLLEFEEKCLDCFRRKANVRVEPCGHYQKCELCYEGSDKFVCVRCYTIITESIVDNH